MIKSTLPKAYYVDNEGIGEILFLSSNYGLEEEYETVERRLQYDQYSELGYVPKNVLLNDGWWFECNNCYKKINEERWNCEEGETIKPVFQNNWIFCCQECSEVAAQERQRHQQEKDKWTRFLTTNYPNISNLFVMVGTDITYASFKFPGSQYEAKWYSDRPNFVSYCLADEAAAQTYFALEEQDWGGNGDFL